MQVKSIHEVVRKAETNYMSGSVLLGEHVNWSMRDTVERIYAYLNSRHTTGQFDSLGREKPFFNIVTAIVNIWYRATKLERKDIIVLPTKSSETITAFLATIVLQDWMKRAHFGLFLSRWGRTLAEYGSAVIKAIERNRLLDISVLPWNRAIVDPISFDAYPRIEKIYLSPDQLIARSTPGDPDYQGYDADVARSLIEARAAERTRKSMSKLQQDNRADFIELYEVHGNMPVPLLLDDPNVAKDDDWSVYRQQMHVVSFVESKRKKGTFQDFTLFKGKEAKDPEMITHLIEEDGRTMGIGAVEYAFDAQWMANHTIKNWKDQMDLVSRVIFQTADKNFAGRNVLTAIETGDILTHDPNMPLEAVPNVGHDVQNMQAFLEQWNSNVQQLTSTPDAMRGKMPNSRSPYALQALLTQQAGSLFEVMTDNKGIYLENILRTYVLPHLKKKLNHNNEIAAILDDHNITKIDAIFVPREAVRRYNQRAKEMILGGQNPPPFDQQAEEQGVKQDLAPLGNQRFLSPGDVKWNELFKDFEWKFDFGSTHDQQDKQAIMQGLTQVLQTLATNPMILQDPNAKLVFNKLLDQLGVISPVELSTVAAAPQPPMQPTPGQGAPQPQPQQALQGNQ